MNKEELYQKWQEAEKAKWKILAEAEELENAFYEVVSIELNNIRIGDIVKDANGKKWVVEKVKAFQCEEKPTEWKIFGYYGILLNKNGNRSNVFGYIENPQLDF